MRRAGLAGSMARGWLVYGWLLCAAASAAPPVDTVDVDLAPLIQAAAAFRERFAVSVPHRIDVKSSGTWERANGFSTWRYSVRIPGALSLSFHADRFRLPEEATLAVTGADQSRARYTARTTQGQPLWSRIARGDTLAFELRLPTADERKLAFSIVALQAGYRVFGDPSADHPQFRKLRKGAATMSAATATACTENFACRATAGNSVNGDATAAIVIGGVALCTATLINNARNDGSPYLLTARHCQTSPSEGITVYWDATSPCGAARPGSVTGLIS